MSATTTRRCSSQNLRAHPTTHNHNQPIISNSPSHITILPRRQHTHFPQLPSLSSQRPCLVCRSTPTAPSPDSVFLVRHHRTGSATMSTTPIFVTHHSGPDIIPYSNHTQCLARPPNLPPPHHSSAPDTTICQTKARHRHTLCFFFFASYSTTSPL